MSIWPKFTYKLTASELCYESYAMSHKLWREIINEFHFWRHFPVQWYIIIYLVCPERWFDRILTKVWPQVTSKDHERSWLIQIRHQHKISSRMICYYIYSLSREMIWPYFDPSLTPSDPIWPWEVMINANSASA